MWKSDNFFTYLNFDEKSVFLYFKSQISKCPIYTKILPPTLIHKKFPSQNDKLLSFHLNSETPCSFHMVNVDIRITLDAACLPIKHLLWFSTILFSLLIILQLFLKPSLYFWTESFIDNRKWKNCLDQVYPVHGQLRPKCGDNLLVFLTSIKFSSTRRSCPNKLIWEPKLQWMIQLPSTLWT